MNDEESLKFHTVSVRPGGHCLVGARPMGCCSSPTVQELDAGDQYDSGYQALAGAQSWS
jgi:hypothetical protein